MGTAQKACDRFKQVWSYVRMTMEHQSQSKTASAGQEFDAALEYLRALRANLKSLSPLTAKERKALPRVTPSVLSMIDDVLQAARENPSILPASTSLQEYMEEVYNCRVLHTLVRQLQEL